MGWERMIWLRKVWNEIGGVMERDSNGIDLFSLYVLFTQ